MTDSSLRVGLLVDGDPTAEQRAAAEWIGARDGAAADVVPFDALDERGAVAPPTTPTPGDADGSQSLGESYPGAGVGDGAGRFDVLWWHRDRPLGGATPLADAAPAIEAFLADGGGLCLSLYAFAAVDALSVESVPPDRVGDDALGEPTGVLWRSLRADHPALDALDGLRHPVRRRGTVPGVRYERVLPADGEPLASTVRGGTEVPEEVTVVSWPAGDGAVLGIGAPVLFAEPPTDGHPESDRDLGATRDRLLAGCLRSLASSGPVPSRPETAADMRRLRERVDETGEDGPGGRPAYHLTAPANWLNDPNGLVRWDGRYHVFYQYNPGGPYHNTIHWGHAVSDDLVTWRDEPVALAPSPDGPDRDGCWSGCAVDDDGTATVLYTGGRGRDQLPCLATADDSGLRSWEKYDGNPVIEAPPADLDVLETDDWRAEFRDHNVWREGDTWYHLVGTGLSDGGGAALLYTADDLREWTYEGPLLAGGPDAGAVWECPELLDLGDRRLLHVSDYENVVYFLGTLEDGELDVDAEGLLDHGDFYAPQSLEDGDRTLTWGWLPEARDAAGQWDAGWSGALSLPRVIELGDDGDLRQRPAAEVTDLRADRIADHRDVRLADGDRRRFDAAGATIEIDAEIALEDAEAVELSVFEAPDRAEHTPIRYEHDGTLTVDRAPSSGDSEAFTDPQSMSVPPYDEPLSLRVFVDRSVVEIYANERHCLTSRVYPTREDAVDVSAVAEGGRASIPRLTAWRLDGAMEPPEDGASSGDAAGDPAAREQ
ncbi:glycoside hydrolase family 32 protein [Halorubrum sp. Hd13]|uniref:glycoside hydrolase family 32 protein n=1 Tax=Halorubrum sp. Hd13 TaxID=1480728 RepID=UPI000B98D566|nr:glycoside hydrolase family 32 protein [Halorubrum sp. Hd13]OYR43845.1 sucrose-6-phosphate hydrolase [Halorubrum sp. Hd13]